MEDKRARLAQPRPHAAVVLAHLGAGHHLADDDARGGGPLAHAGHAAHGQLLVDGVVQPVGVDDGRVARVGGAQGDGAARARGEDAGGEGDGVFVGRGRRGGAVAVAVAGARAEVEGEELEFGEVGREGREVREGGGGEQGAVVGGQLFPAWWWCEVSWLVACSAGGAYP